MSYDSVMMASDGLPLCSELRILHLTGNATISDHGVRTLAAACVDGACRTLTELRLGGNSIGDDGLRALVEAASTAGAMARLQQLHLNINVVGDVGLHTLAVEARRGGAAGDNGAALWPCLHTLNLQHNPPISEVGVAQLAAAIAQGGLPALEQLLLPAPHPGSAPLMTACSTREIRLQ